MYTTTQSIQSLQRIDTVHTIFGAGYLPEHHAEGCCWPRERSALDFTAILQSLRAALGIQHT